MLQFTYSSYSVDDVSKLYYKKKYRECLFYIVTFPEVMFLNGIIISETFCRYFQFVF